MPFQKGHKSYLTEESKRKISNTLKGRMPKNIKLLQQLGADARRGKSLSQETKNKMRLAHLGKKYKKMSAIGRQNISNAHKGIRLSEQAKRKLSYYRNEKNGNWKGDKVSYAGLHSWVNKRLGSPRQCVLCGFKSLSNRKIHWANISREYKRELTDWVRLCVKCHSAYDRGKLDLPFLKAK